MKSNIHGYPKVYNLGHKAIADLLLDPVIIEEKVDGSQISFALLEGELCIRSKGAQIHLDAPPKMFAKAVEVIRGLALHPEWVYRGEYLSKPKHNTLCYDRVPKGHIAVFDIQDGLESYLPYDHKDSEAARLGLECVPRLRPGPDPLCAEELESLLEQPSFLGGQLVEGVVIKNYARFTRDGKATMGKHVSEKFKEVHHKSWKEGNPKGKDIIQRITERLKTEARWEKAVQHLREKGVLEDSPKDIGALIKEARNDTLTEEGAEARETLFKWAWPQIARGLTAGLPEWYKKKLMERQFALEGELEIGHAGAVDAVLDGGVNS